MATNSIDLRSGEIRVDVVERDITGRPPSVVVRANNAHLFQCDLTVGMMLRLRGTIGSISTSSRVYSMIREAAHDAGHGYIVDRADEMSEH